MASVPADTLAAQQQGAAMIFNASVLRLSRIASMLACMPLAAQAHHSNTAYDMTRAVTWRVQVTEFKFVNPHAYVFFTMADGSGKAVEGRCELAARTMLARQGWTIDTIKPGEKLTIHGSPGRNEANVCLMGDFVRADGTEVGVHQQLAK
jgi:hypothetical protein